MVAQDSDKRRTVLAVTATVVLYVCVMRVLLGAFGSWIAAGGTHLLRYIGCP